MTTQNEIDLAQLYRAESGRIIASLMLLTRDLDMAEDALHDAVVDASRAWPERGPPKNRAAWLLTVARRRLIDQLRRERFRGASSTRQSIVDIATVDESKIDDPDIFADERLRLIFTCAHPALAEDVRVPLTLKVLCGLSVREIARAYLVSEAAMQQRLARAKRKIRDAGIGYEVPAGCALAERLPAVLAVIYLMYNESYSAYEGQTLTRDDLAAEAIQLARLLRSMLPLADVEALLGLLLLHESRRSARSNSEHRFVPLEHQNRAHWNQDMIKEGVQLALTSLAHGNAGCYQLQAAISALHALSPSWETTDWQQIQQLYTVLEERFPSPVVTLNKAMSYAYAGDIDRASALMSPLLPALQHYQPFYVARTELACLQGDYPQAACDCANALALTKNDAEKAFLLQKQVKIKRYLD